MLQKAESILTYEVPIISDAGDCSGSDCMGSFNAEEYLPFLIDEDKSELLFALDILMEEMFSLDAIDWCGVYLSIPPKDHLEVFTPCLLKISYRGAISRGLFPLTQDFAQKSNNSTVALTGKPITVDDVQDYVGSGGCYYECDIRVRSEYCHPLFNHAGNVIGIVDIESFTPKSFSRDDLMPQIDSMLERIEALLRAFGADH
jgi:L-methionine (R)-S-oxide reductase